MKNGRLFIVIVFVLVGGLVAGNISYAQTAKDFYKDKIINFVVKSTPGGGFDLWARLIAPHLQTYTGATVVIRNMPQAGGLYSYNHVYNAKADGLTIGLVDTRGLLLEQLFKTKGVRYDYRKVNWIGRVDFSNRMILVANDSPYHTLKDMMAAKEIKVSGESKMAGVPALILIAHALDWGPKKIRPILGYQSGKELMLAVMQKEVDMTSLTDGTSSRFVKEGLVRAFLCVNKQRSQYFPEIPSFYEEIEPPEQKGWPLAVFMALGELRRAVLTTPGVPRDRVDLLREALARCLSNKELLARAAKGDLAPKPLSGPEMEKQIREKITSLSEEQVKEFQYILMEKYY